MKPEQAEALAADFWERAGAPAGFPRDLERAIPLAVPVGVVRLADLRPLRVRRWLLRHGIRLSLHVQDRPLDGCIIAYRGQGVIFLAADLDASIGRMILAHELGHFLADYEGPRHRVEQRLGPSVLPALDGERRPSSSEELASVLAGVALVAHVHSMERGFDPRPTDLTRRVERRATALACELLAPRRDVLARAAARGLSDQPGPWVQLLRDEFGLSGAWAVEYAGRLIRQRDRRRTFTDLLGL